jgi:hypothetical protein
MLVCTLVLLAGLLCLGDSLASLLLLLSPRCLFNAGVAPSNSSNPPLPAAALLSQLSDAATRLGIEAALRLLLVLLLLLRFVLPLIRTLFAAAAAAAAAAAMSFNTGLAPHNSSNPVPAPAAALLSELSDAATRLGIEAALRLLVVLLRDRTLAGQDARTRCRCDCVRCIICCVASLP